MDKKVKLPNATLELEIFEEENNQYLYISSDGDGEARYPIEKPEDVGNLVSDYLKDMMATLEEN